MGRDEGSSGEGVRQRVGSVGGEEGFVREHEPLRRVPRLNLFALDSVFYVNNVCVSEKGKLEGCKAGISIVCVSCSFCLMFRFEYFTFFLFTLHTSLNQMIFS